MKTSLLALGAALLLAGAAHAQHMVPSQVPTAAKTTFQTKFPAAKGAQWEREGVDFEVGFQLNGKTMSAVITPGGVLRETETVLTPAQLPAAVRATLARDYQAARVVEAATIVRADGTTVYEAEVSQHGKPHDVLFTADGRVTH